MCGGGCRRQSELQAGAKGVQSVHLRKSLVATCKLKRARHSTIRDHHLFAALAHERGVSLQNVQKIQPRSAYPKSLQSSSHVSRITHPTTSVVVAIDRVCVLI